MSVVFGFDEKKTIFHRMNGASKLLFLLAAAVSTMITYDERYLLALAIISFGLLAFSKVSLYKIRVVVILMAALMLLNLIMVFLFAPNYGPELYNHRTELFKIAGPYIVTTEQLLYESCILLKHFILMPLCIILVVTTKPSEFAASLNQIGISYKASYAVSLTIRYIPDVIKEFRDISRSQQARGVEMSKKASLISRLKSAAAIMTPLIFSSMEHIEVISNAMELRGFGKKNKRTWYRYRAFKKLDILVAFLAFCVIGTTILLLFVNGGRYWNPFI